MSKTTTLADIVSSNGSLIVPTGSTASRPTANAGSIRFNTDLNTLESANGTAWANVGSGSSSSGGGVSWLPVQNTSFIAIKNSGYLINTATSNVVVTLPATPTQGDNITFVDYNKSSSSNNIVLYPNGLKINSNTANTILTNNGMSVSLVYADTIQGWVAFNGFNVSPIGNYNLEYLVVSGGGGGAAGYASGGGGAGGMLVGNTPVIPGTAYTITVGSGGAGVPAFSGVGWPATAATSGGNSSIGNLVSSVGGGGGRGNGPGPASINGGSGGGGNQGTSGGSGTAGQGNAGGTGSPTSGGGPNYGGGGGGGAGAVGGNGTPTAGGVGGAGLSASITGSSVTYAGGGGGGVYSNGTPGGSGGSGGTGGGGPAGANSSNPGTAGTTNLGGGGGGGGGDDTPSSLGRAGGSGGSGVVIIRYLSNTQRGTGGTITNLGGYFIHTFNSSGIFTA
jgi:hypothetical protein